MTNYRGALFMVALLLSACGDTTTQTSDAEAGQRMYRDGILPSGEPMTAIVGGDVPIVGTQFSCIHCHGRSGMGASEGAYVVPPIGAQFLFEPSPQPQRPAYDRDSLATLLREGKTPSGRELSPELMPRYSLDDTDVGALIDYLETLSAGNSPGVDDTTIRFATVVTEGADPDTRDAIFTILNRFADEINRQTRNEGERWDRGYTPESRLPTVFREWVIDEWKLTGPRDTWAEQLESYYQEAPVFALVSGLGAGTWQDVSEFCEDNTVPCLFPSTDLPYRGSDDFYTMYFSAGLLLESELIAAHLTEQAATSVVQVYCDEEHGPAIDALAEALSDSSVSVQARSVQCSGEGKRIDLGDTNPDTSVVLWLTEQQLSQAALPDVTTYLSSTLLVDPNSAVVSAGNAPVFVAHPFRLPGKYDTAMRRFRAWAKVRDIELTAPRQQAEAFYACLVLKDAVKHMGRFFVRDYALDMLDHAEGLAAYMPYHARPSFGPGQRFINKGGFVVPYVDGSLVTDEALWITP